MKAGVKGTLGEKASFSEKIYINSSLVIGHSPPGGGSFRHHFFEFTAMTSCLHHKDRIKEVSVGLLSLLRRLFLAIMDGTDPE